MKFYARNIFSGSIFICFLIALNCSRKTKGTNSSEVSFYMTKGDQSVLLSKQNVVLTFGSVANQLSTITVDTIQTFQTIDGFGYTLTGGSADLINTLPAQAKQNLLEELFSRTKGIGVSFLRISIGASDLSSTVFSYDDVPTEQTDPTLQYFNLSQDTINLIPLLKQILLINPSMRILGSPWSPPVWMKDNNSSIGGSLRPQFYNAYANYFVKYIQAMKSHGIDIYAITPQNEPLHPGNNPSLYMTAAQQADFIKNHLGPAFQTANISTKIIVYDHNCDRPDYPLEILNDAVARQYVDGSAFHLYAGDISALTQVHNAFPSKNVYFTEQYTASNGDFDGDLKWHLKNVIIGSARNWSKVALEWNLANDPTFAPHTPGGCTVCKGALTIGANVTRNVAYYVIAHASKFVPPGSVRVQSNISGNLHNVAFFTPAGKKVLIVLNDGGTPQSFNIHFKGKWVTTSLDEGAVGSYVW